MHLSYHVTRHYPAVLEREAFANALKTTIHWAPIWGWQEKHQIVTISKNKKKQILHPGSKKDIPLNIKFLYQQALYEKESLL